MRKSLTDPFMVVMFAVLSLGFGCVSPPPPPPEASLDIDTNGVVGLQLAGAPGQFPVVLSVLPGSPAALDRQITPGDEIVSINEVDAPPGSPGARVIPSTKEVPFTETLLMMRGAPGSLVTIKVRRRGARDFSEEARLKVWEKPEYYESTLKRVPASSLQPPMEGTSRVLSIELRDERLINVQPARGAEGK
jgi:PDZ domain-containing protein